LPSKGYKVSEGQNTPNGLKLLLHNLRRPSKLEDKNDVFPAAAVAAISTNAFSNSGKEEAQMNQFRNLHMNVAEYKFW
jgi:hypothetical protein